MKTQRSKHDRPLRNVEIGNVLARYGKRRYERKIKQLRVNCWLIQDLITANAWHTTRGWSLLLSSPVPLFCIIALNDLPSSLTTKASYP